MILILVFLIASTSGENPINFPLQGVKLEDKDKPVFEFDGIDYENLPTTLKDFYTDCDAQHIRCVRHQVSLTPVCMVTYWGYWRDWSNICEFQRQNCLYMRDKGKDKYGKDIDDGFLYLQGEGFKCEHQFRRLRDSGLLRIYLDSRRETP